MASLSYFFLHNLKILCLILQKGKAQALQRKGRWETNTT